MAFIYPMQTIGIIGGGMNSYHLALEAKKMGFKVALLTAQPEPALNVVDFPTVGNLDNPKEILDFTAGLPMIIYQDEHIDFQALESLQDQSFLPQGTDILAITQDRYLEKAFLDDLNINIAPYTTVVNQADVADGLESIGYPAVIKPIQKGIGHDRQKILYQAADVAYSDQFLQDESAILESWIPVDQEYLLMVAKDQDGNVQLLPIIETQYDGHQLIAGMVPPKIAPEVAAEIKRVAENIALHLSYCGLFGISFLATATGNLYAQRIFPGVHAAADVYAQATGISQYALQLRLLSGWPQPKVTVQKPSAMLMILKAIEEESFTQIKIKPDWQFQYYPISDQVAEATPIGQAFVTGDSRDDLVLKINATELWHL